MCEMKLTPHVAPLGYTLGRESAPPLRGEHCSLRSRNVPRGWSHEPLLLPLALQSHRPSTPNSHAELGTLESPHCC